MVAKDVPWDEAIQQVLKDAKGGLHYSEIAERIVSLGLRKSVGATPSNTVATVLSLSLREENTPYLKIGRGEYALKATVEEQAKSGILETSKGDEADTGALRSFGMFWRRDLVAFNGKPKVLGRQGLGASEVDFAEQTGVYLLHDRERVIYVGRAGDTLFSRLKAHTTDRLGGRWDRFSWFGLRKVGENGALIDGVVPWSQTVVIETMEALLIESLEPPLNRKRGDNFSGAEYLQVASPEIVAANKQAILSELVKAAGLG